MDQQRLSELQRLTDEFQIKLRQRDTIITQKEKEVSALNIEIENLRRGKAEKKE
jgi:hypothetical protein